MQSNSPEATAVPMTLELDLSRLVIVWVMLVFGILGRYPPQTEELQRNYTEAEIILTDVRDYFIGIGRDE
ncbi:hypothetical protein FIBSPDRAFT_1007090 [Athelia psychrophila]|uniref:Uncharacterized protein n=1 Tax=Athelia psychrophila TaxID=1759441 RepID=A0A166VU36_9AGAM|nr:hypothetical protein FIBSPDRAFT_1007090 [Fibularhizoctonia sp. CBS 109695]